MIVYRCFGWNPRARPAEPDGVLWVPRLFQGDGRHDNPDIYGCLYLADRALSSVVEQLARFRPQRLHPSLLRRRGLPLALADFDLGESRPLIDLDDPRTLVRERLRPSGIATRDRTATQGSARRLYEKHPQTAGLLWWSTFEASWINVTLFERALSLLSLRDVRVLAVDDDAVTEAADVLGVQRH